MSRWWFPLIPIYILTIDNITLFYGLVIAAIAVYWVEIKDY